MPMETAEQHGGKDPENPFCIHCCKPDGTHKTKKEVREGLLKFSLSGEGKAMLAGMGIKINSKQDAEKYVGSLMASLPAWKKSK